MALPLAPGPPTGAAPPPKAVVGGWGGYPLRRRTARGAATDGDLRGKYANCAAGRCQGCVDDLQGVVIFLNHPWLASESSGEQSYAIFSDFHCSGWPLEPS